MNIFLFLFLLAASPHVLAQDAAALARAALSDRNPRQALEILSPAIKASPSDASLLFSRATALVALGRHQDALADLSAIIATKPSHAPSLALRTRIYIQTANLDAAATDLAALAAVSTADAAAIQPTLDKATTAKTAADAALAAKNCQDAIVALSTLIETCPYAQQIRIQRATCHSSTGEHLAAAVDLKKAFIINPSDSQTSATLASALLAIADIDKALSVAKDCLRTDPDHKACKLAFKRIKFVQKTFNSIQSDAKKGKWRKIVSTLFDSDSDSSFMQLIDSINSNSLKAVPYSHACQAYKAIKKDVLTIEWCSKALEFDADNIDMLIARAEAYTNQADYQEAIADYKRAHELNQNDPRVMDGYQRAQALFRRAGTRDYYKILGVSRDASKREIKRAYRKLAQEWHPDKYTGELSNEQVQKKMSEINQAYEVLSNDDLRERYDNGDDPNNPNQGGGGPGGFGGPFQGGPFFASGFPGGGFQFPGGGFQFHGGRQFQFQFRQ